MMLNQNKMRLHVGNTPIPLLNGAGSDYGADDPNGGRCGRVPKNISENPAGFGNFIFHR